MKVYVVLAFAVAALSVPLPALTSNGITTSDGDIAKASAEIVSIEGGLLEKRSTNQELSGNDIERRDLPPQSQRNSSNGLISSMGCTLFGICKREAIPEADPERHRGRPGGRPGGGRGKPGGFGKHGKGNHRGCRSPRCRREVMVESTSQQLEGSE